MKITYKGKPAWRVGYEVRRVIQGLENFWINRKELLETKIGYCLVFASDQLEARLLARRRVYQMSPSMTRKIGFLIQYSGTGKSQISTN
jgi:hypothetical protein